MVVVMVTMMSSIMDTVSQMALLTAKDYRWRCQQLTIYK
jgi:hypothetical protein